MRILKGLAWSACIVVTVLVMAFAWGRMRGPSDRQADALKLFAQDMKPSKGRNAFPGIWLGDYDLPDDQLEVAYTQERDDLRAWLATAQFDGTKFPEYVFHAAAKYPKLPLLSDGEKVLTCGTQNKDCLGSVRSHRDEVAALLARHAIRLKHDKAYGESDFSWDDLPRDLFTPYAAYGSMHSLWLTSAALEFVDGKPFPAVQEVCANALAQRRLHAHSNTMLATLIAASRMESAARVFVQMLSELPLDQSLPDSCNQAFASVDVKDIDLSASVQSELQSSEEMLRQSSVVAKKKPPTDWINELAASKIGMSRQQAAQFAWMCSNEVHSQSLDDREFSVKEFPVQADVFDWLSNFAGSVLIFIAQPGYLDDLNRQQDGVATLRLVATVLWLRQTHGNGTPLTQRLLQRPAWMRMAEDRHFSLSKDGRQLHMGYHGPQKIRHDGTEWPLPPGL